nr:centriole, cilia and spindle-associated protein isoform X1 [Oncorhynchus nerka]
MFHLVCAFTPYSHIFGHLLGGNGILNGSQLRAGLRRSKPMITAHETPSVVFCFREIRASNSICWSNKRKLRMVTKRIRTEYMKRFKDPEWETYAKCYEEMIKYRLTRRLLEQTHNPWFWNNDSDSESSRSTPQKNKVEPLVLKDDSQRECARKIPPKEPLEQKIPISEELQEVATPENSPPIDVQGAVEVGCGETEEEKLGQGLIAPESGKKPEAQTKTKQSRKPPRAWSQLRKPKETDKKNRHPFALYGGGDKPAEMARKKTHNVGPAASTKEIHQSALRAKTRREVEKQVQKVDKWRVRSAELEKVTITKPDFDPWMTEYMRCFSARS